MIIVLTHLSFFFCFPSSQKSPLSTWTVSSHSLRTQSLHSSQPDLCDVSSKLLNKLNFLFANRSIELWHRRVYVTTSDKIKRDCDWLVPWVGVGSQDRLFAFSVIWSKIIFWDLMEKAYRWNYLHNAYRLPQNEEEEEDMVKEKRRFWSLYSSSQV